MRIADIHGESKFAGVGADTARMETSLGLPQNRKDQPLGSPSPSFQSEDRQVVSPLARTPRLWKLLSENPPNHAKSQWTELESREGPTL